jgi:hypothetical protein
VIFRAMTEGEQVVEDYVSMRLTLKTHPVALLRHILTPEAALMPPRGRYPSGP